MNPAEFYKQHSIFSSLGSDVRNLLTKNTKIRCHTHGDADDINRLADYVQKRVLHESEGIRWKYKIPLRRYQETQLRYANRMFEAMVELDSLTDETISVDQRLICNCRDIAVLLCSLLRENHIAARCRAGFSTYAFPTSKCCIDHVLVEYKDTTTNTWKLCDPLLLMPHHQQNPLYAHIDPFDITKDQFILAGAAWQYCRIYPQAAKNYGFGIYSDRRGLYCIRNKVLQDLAFLNKVEVSPNDLWGYMLHNGLRADPQDLGQLKVIDTVASLTLDPDIVLENMIHIYHTNPNLKVPSIVLNDFHDQINCHEWIGKLA
jgi:hypothetical protein